MKLDSRILEGKKPLDCFDVEEAKQFIGKKGYFCDHRSGFTNISNLVEDVLRDITPDDNYCEVYKTNCTSWEYFLPKEWIKESEEKPEKKYRAFSLNEFLERFKIGEALYIRFKRDKAERVVVFTEYSTPPHKDDGNDTESVCLTGIEHHKSVVCLGMREYYLATLFDCYEYFDGKEWQPFGTEVKEK